jgi:hypothetical protein
MFYQMSSLTRNPKTLFLRHARDVQQSARSGDDRQRTGETHVELESATERKKSEILASENLIEMGGVRCTKVVKYHGVKVTVDRKEQTKVAREQI